VHPLTDVPPQLLQLGAALQKSQSRANAVGEFDVDSLDDGGEIVCRCVASQ
jgi:hypothetical protein